jgi:hypothetical protein
MLISITITGSCVLASGFWPGDRGIVEQATPAILNMLCLPVLL